jgi:hypothetical protein
MADEIAPAAETAPAAGKYDAVINQWVAANFVNTPMSRNTECWNVLQKALEDLKARLNKAG